MLQNETTHHILDQIIAKAKDMYSLPAVVLQVIELTRHDPVDMIALKNCIEFDPALTVKLLRVSNSSFYGLRGEISTIKHALNVLGSRMVRTLVLNFCLPVELTKGIAPRVLERYWRKAVYRAVAARHFAKRFIPNTPDREELFVAGLLHGLGLLAFIQEFGDTYIQFKEHVLEEGGDLLEQEAAVFGFSHACLTGRMLEEWGLPATLVQMISFPHELSSIQDLPDDAREKASILRLADEASDFLVSGLPSALLRAMETARCLRGIEKDAFQNLLIEFESEANALSDLFNLKGNDAEHFRRMLDEAHARLSDPQTPPPKSSGNLQAESKLLDSVNSLRRELNDVSSKMKAKLSHIINPPPFVPKVDLHQISRCFPTLKSKIVQSIARCRQQHCAFSLVFVHLDDPVDVQLLGSSEDRRKLQQCLRKSSEHFAESPDACELLGEEMVALLLENYQRTEAIQVSRALLEIARRHNTAAQQHFKISIGVATLNLPPRNFPEQDLIDTAVRCLETARRSGGDAVKSFEL